jgi:hypothetical protein
MGVGVGPMTITPERPSIDLELDLRTPAPRDELDPALASLAARIGGDHPEVEPGRILVLLLAAHDRTADAPVQMYRLLLAERAVREHLRWERRAARSQSASIPR